MHLPGSLASCALASLLAGPAGAAPLVQVVPGVTEDGALTPRWSAMLRERLPADRHAALAGSRRPLSSPERAWLDLVRSRADAWDGMRRVLEQPFRGVPGPEGVSVVVGNRAASGDDAFTHDATTIGFDLGELQSAYGDAGRPDNAGRIDRFFRHEYTHLMQRAWLAAHPWDVRGPEDVAVVEIWKEGLGNLHSLSSRWVESGALTATARETLARLEPRLVARLALLQCAPSESVARLTADLSRGPFAGKWGALPVALWLATEPGDPIEVQRAFVTAGPRGVWDLAARRLPAPLSTTLLEARQAAPRCAPLPPH